MKRALGLALGLCLVGSAAATELDLSVESGGSNSITVAPGEVVNYEVIGSLSDDVNEGLALAGFDLECTCGPLSPADEPTTEPMKNFAIGTENLGINNPAGYGGTQSGDVLLQVGGGQNTIKNVESNAPFPVGSVILDVAKPGGSMPSVVLVTGSLTAPMEAGEYTLTATNMFANVIAPEETGDVFFKTIQADPGTVTPLTITVCPPSDITLIGSTPAHQERLTHSANNAVFLEFDDDIAAPGSGQVLVREIQDECILGADMSSSFTMTVENNGDGQPRILKIRENGQVLAHRTWYSISNNTTDPCDGVADFEVQLVLQIGDANNDGTVTFADLARINGDCCGPVDPGDPRARSDINGDGNVTFADMSVANGRIPSAAVANPCSP